MQRICITLNILCMSVLPPPSTCTFHVSVPIHFRQSKNIPNIRIKIIYRKITTARLNGEKLFYEVYFCVHSAPPMNSPEKSHSNSSIYVYLPVTSYLHLDFPPGHLYSDLKIKISGGLIISSRVPHFPSSPSTHHHRHQR